MIIAFATKTLRSQCESLAKAEEKFGHLTARFLLARIADLRAAANFSEVVAGNPRESGEHMIITVCKGCKMEICANHRLLPRHKDGAIDWSRVTRVKVLTVAR